nr:hypothetical protein Iba_chr08cCG11230 [Ipomoea batatas]
MFNFSCFLGILFIRCFAGFGGVDLCSIGALFEDLVLFKRTVTISLCFRMFIDWIPWLHFSG